MEQHDGKPMPVALYAPGTYQFCHADKSLWIMDTRTGEITRINAVYSDSAAKELWFLGPENDKK